MPLMWSSIMLSNNFLYSSKTHSSMFCEVVLVIGFGFIKVSSRLDFGDDRCRKAIRLLHILLVLKGLLLLLWVGVKDNRSILCAKIRTLAIDRGWIVVGEEHLQQ